MKTIARAGRATLVAAALALIHCGGVAAPDAAVPADGGGGGGEDGSRGDAGSGSSDAGAPCPSSFPAASAGCAPEGLVCGYGSDPRLQCRDTATCTHGAWVDVPASANGQCPGSPPPSAASCPASIAAAQGKSCSPQGAYCVYEQGLSCLCTDCPNPYPLCQAGPVQWACESPNMTPGCPASMPNLGTACTGSDGFGSPDGTTCTYGCANPGRTCHGGIWVEGPPQGCPVSTRYAKKDIRYLTSREEQALADEAQSIRLATYEYIDPAQAGRRRLGFILEDNPVPFGEDPEHNQVDLYGYTSTLAAAIQVQNRRVEALELELRALRDLRSRECAK